MTYPADQTPPVVPGHPPVKPPSKVHMFLTSPKGIVLMLGAVGVVILASIFLSPSRTGQTAKSLDVDVLTCTFTGDTATVGLSVTNTGKTTIQRATIHIEYRDSADSRIDTDTATVRDIAPGDTVRSDEQTLLDARATSGTCHVTDVS
jgi:hypothetical protein